MLFLLLQLNFMTEDLDLVACDPRTSLRQGNRRAANITAALNFEKQKFGREKIKQTLEQQSGVMEQVTENRTSNIEDELPDPDNDLMTSKRAGESV